MADMELFKKLGERFGPGVMEVVVANTNDAVRAEAEQHIIGEGTINLFNKLIERFGDGVLEVMETHTIDSAREQLQTADVPNRDLRGVFTQLWDHLGDKFVYTIEENTPNRLSFHLTECPYVAQIKALGGQRIGYALFCAYDIGFCQGLNPKIRFSRSEVLMLDGACCNHTYELEE